MIFACPRCDKKNRLPENLQIGGEYRCGRCGQILIGLSNGDRPSHTEARNRSAPRSPQEIRPPEAHTARARRGERERVGTQTRQEARAGRALVPLLIAYASLLLAVSLSNTVGPERWWPGSLNLYLPQWLWAIPGIPLLPLTFRFARRWTWLPALSLAWVFGPLMGFCGNLPPPAIPGGGTRLRVMTYNVKWGIHDGHAIAEDVRAFHPDLLQMQDSAGVLNGELGQALAGWNVRISGQYIIASPLPLPPLEDRDISFAGSNHHVIRYTLPVGASPMAVYDVHLLSPRWGLNAARHRQMAGLVGNVDARLQEANRLADYIAAERGPVLLTGDLNAPVQSLVCQQLFGAGLRDAFSDAGLGYGYTYGAYTRLGRPYVRIDHILVSRQWRVERCWVGNTRGSEHCPVIADLVLSAPKP